MTRANADRQRFIETTDRLLDTVGCSGTAMPRVVELAVAATHGLARGDCAGDGVVAPMAVGERYSL